MTPGRWLTILGIGEDGLDGLSPTARRLLADAELVVGGERHLALAGLAGGGASGTPETFRWPTPLTDALPALLSRRGRPVVVLATGDPFFYGVGTTLAGRIPADEMLCIPGPSAFSLAASRLGWSQQETTRLSLHGRAFERVLPHLQPRARILALSWDGTTPGRLAATLTARGMGRSRLTVLEAMGGPRERIRSALAEAFDLGDVDPLNTVAVEVVAGPDARTLPLTPGLPDDAFEHDGQITKRELRAVTLSALAPRRGERLWDIGAGSGSIGIEWMLADPANRTIAIEPRPDRAARVARNAAALGVPDLVIVPGEAPAALADLPDPDAVFIGGGAGDPGVVDAGWARLASGGRLVVNAVTLETQAQVTDWCRRFGGELVSIAIAKAVPVGSFLGWKPAMPVVQWRAIKP
ncbi:precorrin-6y C5,15-methyltransferase (decarboxylating) subunit CbiE [Prosthecomicrobium sp. N25]|uniref:precorrin-6y C5,15-methyltransferase (decarboxylating) subunit CbiE n=1 Tax=Prosthecomicrobium sp. N25 TaxID=3129254 RepID=UPI003076C3AF